MVWFLIVLIVACVVYMISVVASYNSALAEAQDVIRNLEQQAEALEKTVSQEREAIGQRRARLEDLNETTSDMKQEIFLTDSKLKLAQKEENDLEMSMYKQEFKRSKQRGY